MGSSRRQSTQSTREDPPRRLRVHAGLLLDHPKRVLDRDLLRLHGGGQLLKIGWLVPHRASAAPTSATASARRGTPSLTVERAAWDPGFYCLDQPIAVGVTDEFAFWRVVDEFYGDRGPEKLVFYTGIWYPDLVMVAQGTITAILHPDLGQILEVDTSDDYLIRLADRTTLRVNSEEAAGEVTGAWAESASGETHPLRPLPTILNWRMVVEFDSLTDLRPGTDGWSRARARWANG